MNYRKVGKWGLQVSELSLGSWVTFGKSLDLTQIKQLMKAAFDAGINFFDTAEVYAEGAAELLMGQALELFAREEIVVSTKLFWGGQSVNSKGLSWKHLVEGTKRSLRRLNLDYIDILYCHRPDPNTPMEETVRAMDHLIQSGYAFYWGTSEWPKEHIAEAHRIAEKYLALPPIVEQPQYNLFSRYRVEKEYAPLYDAYGMGLTTWSPLDSGILTGKYNDGIPSGSRLDTNKWLQDHLSYSKIEKVKKLQLVAAECDCSSSQLAIAWCLKNPRVSSVILGATSLEQLEHNLGALSVKEQMSEEMFRKISQLFT